MVESKEKTQARNFGKNWGLIQSGSVLIGILYSLIFLLMIPTFINLGYTFDSMLINSGLLLLAVFIVHILTNGFYYLIVSVPFVLAAIFAIFGWLIWINTPLVVYTLDVVLLPLEAIISIPNSDMLSEFFSRIGQSFMMLGGGLWWLIKKAKDINYAAIYIYIITLGILGIFSGFINPGITIVFIIFWATLNYKIYENPNVNTNKQLELLFKVIASLAILFAVFKNIYYANNTWHGEISYGLIIYSIVIYLLVSFGIWKPKAIKKHIPIEGQNIIMKIIVLSKKFIFLNK